jgi:hypothetical protein
MAVNLATVSSPRLEIHLAEGLSNGNAHVTLPEFLAIKETSTPNTF